jgi:fluoroacetyl-CoA thioesterase
MGLAVGLRATVRHVVTEADTAIRAGSGDVPVLATPRLLALAEAACVAALESHLDAGMTSVGTGVALEHRRASPVGTEIEVEAELTELAGRRLVFGFIVRHLRPGASGGPGGDAAAGGGPAGASTAGKGPADGGPRGDEDLVVGAGTVQRIVVDRAKFLARAGVPEG